MSNFIECPDCEGQGHDGGCCGGAVMWPELDFCSGCYEHSVSACQTCDGNREIAQEAPQ
jgi:hypothetical protein